MKIKNFIVFVLFSLYSFGLDVQYEKNMQTFHAAVEYSDKLLNFNKEEIDFNFCIDYINKNIFTYGEDSVQVYLSYLLLSRHYILYNDINASKELLDFANTIKENNNFENNSDLKQTFYTLKGQVLNRLGKYTDALNYFKKALNLYDKVKNKD